MDKFCRINNHNLKLYASLGNPTIFGQEYYNEISKAKIAINFNRTDFLEGENKNKFMGSSDRMNHFMGVGTCTFSPKIKGLDMLYTDDEDIVYFDGMNDCFNKINYYLSDERYKQIGFKW
ncbi:MAG: glycosyltransferase [Aliarcobacter sp.]|nr:glycosyltransferase [Aliarcobacter sp.]